MTANRPRHLSFLVRFWQEEGADNWRGMVFNPLTGERKGFLDLREALDYLYEQADSTPADEKGGPGPEQGRSRQDLPGEERSDPP